jgi:hypothetical protein
MASIIERLRTIWREQSQSTGSDDARSTCLAESNGLFHEIVTECRRINTAVAEDLRRPNGAASDDEGLRPRGQKYVIG